MRSWFQRFMSGRYGFDQLGGFLCIASFILRVPRGRGKISITCPKCHNQFIKKS